MTAIQPLFSELEPMPKASAGAPIGIFDSGIGGMSVAAEIAKYLPNEHIVYYADTAYVPYGPRSDAEIRNSRLEQSIGYIVKAVKLQS